MILQPNHVQYSRYSIIASLLFLMMYMLGIWFNEYHGQLNLMSQVSNLRQDIYQEAYQFQDAVRNYDKRVEERTIIERRIQESQQRQQRDTTVTQPLLEIQKPVPTVTLSVPPPPRVEDTNIPSKIHLLGVLELELSESTSWHTLIKMVVTVLITFSGIKLINLAFRRWEKSVAG